MSDTWDIVVVGAGAAGLLAASRAAECGGKVLLLEKNRKAGVKILMSGGTRCNLTQATDARGIVDAFGKQGRFLHSALAALSPDDLVALIEAEGVRAKVEPTGKIFPESDRAVDVLDALLARLERSRATLALDEPVLDVKQSHSRFLISTSRRTLDTAKVIITSGGQSYSGCGTTGDGYTWAKALGHKIVPPRPALVPLTTSTDWVTKLRGVTMSDVAIDLRAGDQRLAQRRGSLLFTHWGLSGPAVMDVSRHVTVQTNAAEVRLICDFLPAMSRDAIDAQLRVTAAEYGSRAMEAVVGEWLPRSLADALLAVAKVPGDRRAAELSKREKVILIDAIKQTEIPIAGTMGFKKAEVTAGGVSLDQVDSSTMQSKLVLNLYLAGEVLDLDGPIGGYNFQAAFSTGWLAGENAAQD
ncbi:MAG: NAD(P)/FAD-dependent oxidoreductase [Pirellulales bacterium]|nr:NAD(P)/FAD-dependent oxidoreductase [Pirellulales bacterium]